MQATTAAEFTTAKVTPYPEGTALLLTSDPIISSLSFTMLPELWGRERNIDVTFMPEGFTDIYLSLQRFSGEPWLLGTGCIFKGSLILSPLNIERAVDPLLELMSPQLWVFGQIYRTRHEFP